MSATRLIPKVTVGSIAILLAGTAGRGAEAPRSSDYVSQESGLSQAALVEAALARNADLLATRQRLAEAQGLLRQAGLRPNPGLEASFTSGRVLNSPGERELTLGYAHTFELGSKRTRRVRVAELGAELATLEIADRERQLRGDVKARYGEALAAVRNLEAAERLLELNQQSYRIAEARTREGEAAPLEQNLLRVEVNRMEADRLRFRNQVERALMELKTLAGMSLDEPLRLRDGLSSVTVPASLNQVLEQALGARPDLQAARLQETLGDAEIEQARAEAIPNLAGFARYSQLTARFDQFGLSPAGTPVAIRDKDNLLSAGISINIPTRNRNQGMIQAAVARREASRRRREFVEQVVRRDVLAAFTRHQTAQQALKVFDQGVLRQSQENVQTLRAAYQLGELRMFDVINEQRRLIDTQRAYTDLLEEGYLAAVELERAVGRPVF